jgi:hypothetical protein
MGTALRSTGSASSVGAKNSASKAHRRLTYSSGRQAMEPGACMSAA